MIKYLSGRSKKNLEKINSKEELMLIRVRERKMDAIRNEQDLEKASYWRDLEMRLKILYNIK